MVDFQSGKLKSWFFSLLQTVTLCERGRWWERESLKTKREEEEKERDRKRGEERRKGRVRCRNGEREREREEMSK
jgi:hypothetical protein